MANKEIHKKQRIGKWIGRNIILWAFRQEEKAYSDQMGIARAGRIVLEEIPAVIIGVRKESSKKFNLTAKAADSRIFTHTAPSYNSCQWFPDPLPTSGSKASDGRNLYLVEACNTHNTELHSPWPYITEKGERARPKADMLCLKHNQVIMLNGIPETIECQVCKKEKEDLEWDRKNKPKESNTATKKAA